MVLASFIEIVVGLMRRRRLEAVGSLTLREKLVVVLLATSVFLMVLSTATDEMLVLLEWSKFDNQSDLH